MEEEKDGLTADEYTKDELTYIQYKKQKQAALLDANEELKSLVSVQRANKGESEENEKEAESKIREYLKTHNEGKENNEYLVRGAELQCSCGSHTRKLNLNTCHGVYMKGHPAVHELDCVSGDGKNITWFGVCDHEDFESEQIVVINQDGSKRCGLKCNPKLIGVWMDSYEGTKIVDNSYKTFAKRFGLEFKSPQSNWPVILKNAGDDEERHMPQFNLSQDIIQLDRFKGNWSVDSDDDTEDTLEGYACNVLTVGSFLVCQHGGIISPVNSGQDREVQVDEFVYGEEAYNRVMKDCDEEIDKENNCDDLLHTMIIGEGSVHGSAFLTDGEEVVGDDETTDTNN